MPTVINLEPLAGELTGRAFGNWLRTSGASLFRLYETGAELYEYLQDSGVSFSRSAFYNIRREVLELTSSSNRLLAFDDDRLIPQNWHVKSHGLSLTTDYQYRVHLFGNDPETGILKDEWITVVSDRQLTKADVHAMASAYLGEYEEVGLSSRQMDNVQFAEVQPMKR